MTAPGGEWVQVGGRTDWVPADQPPSPDGAPGLWHVVGDSDGSHRWEWHERRPPPPPPMPPGPAPRSTQQLPPYDAAGPFPQQPAAWGSPLSSAKPGGAGRGIAMGCGGAALGAVLVAVLIVVVLFAALASLGEDEEVSEATQESRAASCNGLTYPDQQPQNDTCATSGTLDFGGLRITAQPLTPVDVGGLEGRALCSEVAIVNVSDGSRDYNELDFKIQPPSGNVATGSTFSFGGTLNSGVLITGSQRSGRVCGDDTGERGAFVFIYKPNSFKGERGIWLFDIS